VARANLSNSQFEDFSLPSCDGTSQLFIRQFGSAHPQLHFLLVHGALEHSGRHKDLIEFLLQNFGQDVAVTVYDHVGHGRSGGGRAWCGHFNCYVEDMKIVGEFAQKINKDNTKTFILAHSLGGLVSLTRLLDPSFGWPYPLHGLIFSSPCIKPKMVLGQYSEMLLEKLDKFAGKLHLPLIYGGKDLSRDPDRANDFDIDNLIPRFITVRMAREVIEASKKIRGLSYYLKVPSLFLIAGTDHIVDSESTSLFAHGIDKKLREIVTYPNHYHELWNEIDRFEIFETMKKWIQKTLKEKA
jgi:alpha-beta hydrolase superfamily lysophospholipase